MLFILLRRKFRSSFNGLAHSSVWKLGRNCAFSLVGLCLLLTLYYGFIRILSYLQTVPLIGELLLWKLTSMVLLMTFSMVVISSLLTSLTTLYYSFDLKFLMNAPITPRTVFIEKSLESIFFSSWMIFLVLVPYISALVSVNGYGFGFFLSFFSLAIPFLVLAASFGLAFTLALLYFFPSSRTRDMIWVLSSLSLTFVYVLARFANPERLIQPDSLGVVADYLHYLQAPTAPYLPSWWMTKALSAMAASHYSVFAGYAAILGISAVGVYALLVYASGALYFSGYSGACEGAKRLKTTEIATPWEVRCFRGFGDKGMLAVLFWRERLTFFRDVKHWSQMLLVIGLVFVYLLSIYRLPLDNADLRSVVSFLNVAAAGFVLAALGLRFTYPAISLEGKSFWVLKTAPVSLSDILWEKYLFSAIPMTLIALILGCATNVLLQADFFTAIISLLSLLVITWALCAMAIGFGAMFPMFNIENIHQIESSLGGFVYMACALFYISATVMILSWPISMHFHERFGRLEAWNARILIYCAFAWLALNLAAFILPWKMGKKALDRAIV